MGAEPGNTATIDSDAGGEAGALLANDNAVGLWAVVLSSCLIIAARVNTMVFSRPY